VKSSDLVRPMGISRQALASHLSELVRRGVLVKSGSTRNATYELKLGNRKRAIAPSKAQAVWVKKLKGLEEDFVCDEVFQALNLKYHLSKKAQTIFRYAFTEMLNNAIDHSKSIKATIQVELLPKEIEFRIKDSGIGIFRNIQKKFKLRNELEGVEHLLKGKQTTKPKQHSGEGIFFTSRIADTFTLKSHTVSLTFNNLRDEVFLKEERFEKGTTVRFRIHLKSRKLLSDLFRRFTNTNHVFDRTETRVVVSSHLGNLSRSEAKRLLNGLEKFKKVTFDFKGVKEIGQGFADEIFRVFQNLQPKIQLSYENANSAVEFMIRRSGKREDD